MQISLLSTCASVGKEVGLVKSLGASAVQSETCDSVQLTYSLVELQGKIMISEAETEQTICKLFFESNGAPYLVIGKQKLSGKRVKLAKPMAITRLKVGIEDAAEASAIEVVGFVWEKLLFDSRPTLTFDDGVASMSD